MLPPLRSPPRTLFRNRFLSETSGESFCSGTHLTRVHTMNTGGSSKPLSSAFPFAESTMIKPSCCFSVACRAIIAPETSFGVGPGLPGPGRYFGQTLNSASCSVEKDVPPQLHVPFWNRMTSPPSAARRNGRLLFVSGLSP